MKMIMRKNALKICYFLMAADGLITETERSKFDELGEAIDDQYRTYRDSLLWECKREGMFSPDRDMIYLLLDLVDRELKEGVKEGVLTDTIPGRLLVWNMLTIALCDKDYNDGERRLVENVVRRMDVDVKDFKEMEQTLIAANSVSMEMKFLRENGTGDPDIEYQLKNLKERERIIAANAREQMR